MSDPLRIVDDIVKLGKWAYHQIPWGEYCKGCSLLEPEALSRGYSCNLRPSVALQFNEAGALKGDLCPAREYR